MLNVFLIVWYLAICVYLLIRTHLVFVERSRVLDAIYEHSWDDIKARRDWIWRYRDYRSVEFYEMVFSLRPIKSFYKDARCVKPSEPSDSQSNETA